MLPVLKWCILLLALARVIIFMVALKFPNACRAQFYIEVSICALTTLVPRQAHQDWDYMAQIYFLVSILNFCLFYCNFLPSLICSGVVNIFVLISGALVYDH